MTLAACASDPVPAPAAPTVVVRTVRETPPAELTRCPVRAARVPRLEGELPAAARDGIVAVFAAYDALFGQATRLIAWNTGEPCSGDPAE